MQEDLQDKYHLARILFYATGTLTQLPTSFFLIANGYWMYKFRDTSLPYNVTDINNERTEMQTNFTSQFNIVAQITSLVLLLVTMFLGTFFRTKLRIFSSLAIIAAIFIATIVLAGVDTDSWQETFYIVTFVTGSVLSGITSIFSMTVFQLVGKFPPAYLSTMLSGQAICGIAASLVQIGAIGISASTNGTAYIYFSIGLAFIVGVFLFYIYMCFYSDYFIYYMNKEIEESNIKITKQDLISVIKKRKYLIPSLIVILGSTIMINPGLTALVVSVNPPTHDWNLIYFVPVCVYLIFNLFDFIGRVTAPLVKYPENGLVILILAVVRTAFIPLLLFCNLQPRHNTSVAFNSDTAFIIFMILFSLSSGYLMNLCVYQIPLKTTTPAESQVSLIILVLVITTSLALCSLLAEGLKKAI